MTKGNKACLARETVYDRCAYVGCYNGRFINGRRLFHFPSERDRRLEMWIERSGNFRLRTWAASSLRKAGLCGDHFDEKCFTNASRKALRRNVVPRHYTEDRKFRKLNGESTAKNNENKIKDAATEKEADDPLNCDAPLKNSVDSAAAPQRIEISDEGTSFPVSGFTIDEANIKTDGDRSPSPTVEFIVEELDESFIFEESRKSEDPEPETSVDDSMFESEEKVIVESDQLCEQRTPTESQDTEKSTITGGSVLRVNRSEPEVRTYYRSKNHPQPKLELASEESDAVTNEEPSASIETITELKKQSSRQIIPQSNAQLKPQSNPQLNRQLNPWKPRTNVGYISKRVEKKLTNYRERNKQLRKTLQVLKQKVRRQKAREINFMRVREMLKNVDEFLDIQECMNPVARAMVKIALHKHHAPYTKEEKDFSTQFYQYAGTAFQRLRSAGVNFPGRSTIRKWLSEIEGEPSACEFSVAPEDEENEEGLIEDVHEMEEMDVEIMKEAVDDAEDAIDELVERLEEEIEDVDGNAGAVDEIPPDEEDEEDLK